MGSTGDPPVPVGDPPTGTSKAEPSRRLSLFAADALPIPSGESPDGTGQWPVLPKTQLPNTLLANPIRAAMTRRDGRDSSERLMDFIRRVLTAARLRLFEGIQRLASA